MAEEKTDVSIVKNNRAESFPRGNARIAGLLYFIEIAANGLALAILSSVIVRDHPAATASNILAHELSFRLGFAADLIGITAYVGVTAILYGLLKPVSRTLSLLAAFFSLVGCATWAINSVNYIAPLVFLKQAAYSTAFTIDQLQAFGLAIFKLHVYGAEIAMAFFGFYCLSIGYLILKSLFLPRILGPLLMIAGVGYLVNSFAAFVLPSVALYLSGYTLMPGVVAETALALWLLVFGVNVTTWRRQAGAEAMQPAKQGDRR